MADYEALNIGWTEAHDTEDDIGPPDPEKVRRNFERAAGVAELTT